jgi:hypothetical protein
VEGIYAPLFAEDENVWIVERVMSFMDFQEFVDMMIQEARDRGGRRQQESKSSRK